MEKNETIFLKVKCLEGIIEYFSRETYKTDSELQKLMMAKKIETVNIDGNDYEATNSLKISLKTYATPFWTVCERVTLGKTQN